MKRNKKHTNYESEDDDNDVLEEVQEYYDWVMIPNSNSEDKKTGVTFKGDDEEYLIAKDVIRKLFDEKGAKFSINERQIRIVDNPKNKPIKIEVKPAKGPVGKVNITIFDANKSGSATIMITKTKDAELIHVKTLAFKIVKYLLDGIIDGEIKESDLDSYREEFVKSGKSEEQLFCKVCEKTFKSKTGFKLHKTRVHRKDEQNKCKKCNFFFQGREYLEGHIENCTQNKQSQFLTLQILSVIIVIC